MSARLTSPAGAPNGARSSFLVHLDLQQGRMRLAGRLDGRTAHLVHDAVTALLLDDRDRWTVDVGELAVADHAGLRAIGAAYRRLVRQGRRMTLCDPSPALAAALARLRLDTHVLADRGSRAGFVLAVPA